MIKQLLRMAVLLGAVAAHFLRAGPDTSAAAWVNISDPLLQSLTNSGIVVPWPGNTGGVAVDRATGRLYVDVCNLGLWSSTNHGDSFAPIAAGKINGRCEFGYALNCDPAGHRMACLLLDGQGGLTRDGGATWQPFASVGRNWEYGAVDWSDPQARAIFAARHESGGEMYLSADAGGHWRFLGPHPEWTALGIFNARTLVAGTKDGILRSTNAGETWTRVALFHPVGRVAVSFAGATWWLAKEGLLTTRDHGVTWGTNGATVEAGWGPLFGRDARQVVVAGTECFWQTADAGRTWRRLAPLPPFPGGFAPTLPGQFMSIAWDPQANILYASRLGNPTFRLQLPN